MEVRQRFEQIAVGRIDDGAIATVTMQRPERRNALSLEMMCELTHAFRALGEDTTVHSVILRGQGPAFSAGHDLQELQCTAGSRQDALRFQEIFDACVDLMQTVQAVPIPVIAQVEGVATAAGCQLVATCDLAIASTQARFATPGVRIGLFCSTPMVALSRAVGRKHAIEMLLTGDFIDAKTAEQWGLVNRAVAPEGVAAETLALARKIGAASRSVVGLGKRTFYEQIDLPQPEAYAYTKGVMSSNALERNAQEGMRAFLEKRTPVWRE